jgi:hypothetical protein
MEVPMRMLRSLLFGALFSAGLVTLLSGCGGSPKQPAPGNIPKEMTADGRVVAKEQVAEAVYGWHFTDPRQLVASSELVVLGRVERVERGPASPQGDAVETIRYLHVKVEQRLYGRLSGDQVVLQDQGWLKIDGQPEKPFRLEGMIRLEAGDRAFLFLHKDPDTGFYEQLDDQAAYRVQGGEIIDSQRTDPMVRRIELMRDRDLVQLVTDTAAAIRRGEIKPARPRSSG